MKALLNAVTYDGQHTALSLMRKKDPDIVEKMIKTGGCDVSKIPTQNTALRYLKSVHVVYLSP